MPKLTISVPVERLQELFEVREGSLYRLVAAGKAKAGQRAGNPHNGGYERVRVDGEYLLVHRVIYAMTNGRWPEGVVDHSNGVRLSNDPANLRDATYQQNMQNRRPSKNNTSGAPGVSWNRERGKWMVLVSGKFFGRHEDLEFADLVAQEARRKLFGAFAPALS